jgi:cytoskeletal protein RodZ
MLNEKESKKEVMSHLASKDDTKIKASANLDGEKTTMDELKAEMGVKKEAINVHSMPGKFVATAANSSSSNNSGSSKGGSGSGKKLILIAIALVLLVIIVIAGVLYFIGQEPQVPDTNENTNAVVNEDINTNQNTNVNTNTNENTNINENTNTNTNQNTNVNLNENTNTNTNENNNNSVADFDNDGLSQAEELLFSTNPDLEDTDKDGYKDGQEIASLYNPLLPGADLSTSGLVIRFNNNIYNYALLRPKAWLVKTDGGNLAEMLVLPNSESGESFTISTINNAGDLSLNDALTANAARLGTALNYENYSLAGEPALRSRDGHNVIAIHNNFIFIISYDASSPGGANFNTVFDMMLNSFEWTVAQDNPGGDDDAS